MKNRKILIAAIGLAVLIAVLAGVYFAARPATEAGAKAITITVIHADGSEKQFQYRTDEEYLGPVLLAEGLAEGEVPIHGETYGKYTGEFTAEALSKYVESMTGDSLRQLLDSRTDVMVKTKLPVFTSEYSVDLIPALEALGIEDLFDETAADLSGMATSSRGNIFISKVFQKTFIEVDTEGTRAAAVTDIAASDSAAMVEPDYKEVYLDRPFLYMIVDDATGVPVFMGTVTEL